MSNLRDAAIGFEAVKVSMSQDRNGIVLRLNVHPNDCPPELHTDWVGTRYMVAMVRLNDHDEPELREEQQRVERLIASAGLLCRNQEFAAYLVGVGLVGSYDPHNMEPAAIKAVRDYCGIASRTEFRDNSTARKKFEELREDFRIWKKLN
jgi:hypothetical protein